MSKEGADEGRHAQGLVPQGSGPDALAGLIQTLQSRPPANQWNPPFCGDIDMRIARDGTWFYCGTPIGRPALVKLFASVLRREERGYVLVTPVEKVGIVVEDAAFLAVELRVEPPRAGQAGPDVLLRTNVDDWVTIGPRHPLRLEPGASDGLVPYVEVREQIWARLTRPVFYELVALGEVRDEKGISMFGIASAGVFFPMMPAAEALAESVVRDGKDVGLE